ncbi:MAG: aspartate aminotransferase family protein [Candidatus Helarchaeota archaeon]
MEIDSQNFENIYSGWVAKRPIEIVTGKGVYLYDKDGKGYIDCIGGNGVAIIGHSHPKLVEAIKNQAEKLIICPTIMYNEVRAKLYKKLADITPEPLSKSFLSNSGAESVECAIKLAKRHTGKPEIIAMKRAFHGRTHGALSATWNPKYKKPFEPLVPRFKHVSFGDIEAIKNNISKETAAIIVEPVQGEAGVIIPPPNFLKELRGVCDDNEILLIFDEVQTGFGRTGKLFAGFGHWNVVPDIMCLAKAVSGGIPMGVTIAKPEVFDSLKSGEHYSTFGGNPLASAAALASIDIIIGEKLPEKSEINGKYFLEQLNSRLGGNRLIRDIRGIGLMIAIELRLKVKDYVLKAIEKGVLFLTSGKTTIRMLPPLTIGKSEIDKIIDVIEQILKP